MKKFLIGFSFLFIMTGIGYYNGAAATEDISVPADSYFYEYDPQNDETSHNNAQTEVTDTNTPETDNTNTPATGDTNTETVYIGKTGTKYHKSDCSSLKGKGTAVSLSEALSQGRTPCGICYKNTETNNTTTPTTGDTNTPATSDTNTPATGDTNADTVYIGKTGTKYHRSDCSSLKGKGTAIPLSEAVSQGRTPCGICMGD